MAPITKISKNMIADVDTLITSTFEVNTQNEQLSLPATMGDIAIRTDLKKTFILSTNDPTIIGNWKLLQTPVESVAGLVGDVTTVDLKTALSLGTASERNVGTTVGNIPVLDAFGKLSATVFPSLILTDTFIVNNQQEMLDLTTAEQGDVAIRNDVHKSFILTNNTPSVLSSWQELLTPTSDVTSVAGLTGAIDANSLNDALGIKSMAHVNVTVSTLPPSGGEDGDIWCMIE